MALNTTVTLLSSLHVLLCKVRGSIRPKSHSRHFNVCVYHERGVCGFMIVLSVSIVMFHHSAKSSWLVAVSQFLNARGNQPAISYKRPK